MVQSRTSKSIKNSIVATSIYIVNLGLQFFSRKIFLDYLGTEILGLNTTAMNLLQFLNLAELGISAAVGFTLYKPLHDNDFSAVNEIVSLQGQIYRRIAIFIIGGAVVLMLFFPLIFKKIDLPLWYAYASFGVLLYSALLGYFVNYKQIVLTANQQDYKVQYSYKSVMILKVAAQMFAVYYLKNGYEWWLILELIFATIASISLSKMTKVTFPRLITVELSFKDLRTKYPDFSKKVKQLFFHKIGGFALTQSSSLIIYAYTSLTIVALYGNYLIIITGLTTLFAALFNGINASIGNLIAEGNKERIEEVFVELYSLRFLLVVTVCFVTYFETQNFIILWIGRDYLLQQTTLMLMVLTLYISLSRYSVDQYVNGFGLFQDIYAPIIEAIINISLSVILGAIYGLNGVLTGSIVSLLIIAKIWKPYFLCKNGLIGFLPKYIKIVVKHLLCAIFMFFFYYVCLDNYMSNEISSFPAWLAHCILLTTYSLGVLGLLLIVSKSGLQLFFRRVLHKLK